MNEHVRNILRKGRDVVLQIKGHVEYSIWKNKILSDECNETKVEDLWAKTQVNCVVDEKLPVEETDLSIIIPLYNSERFIDKCLQSFLNQKTKYKYELVLIDDQMGEYRLQETPGCSILKENILVLLTMMTG